MKIAVLCDFPYWEGKIGTSVRHESLCRSLAKVCDLTVISSVSLPQKYQDFATKAPYRLIDRSVLKEVNAALGNPQIPGVPPERQVTVVTIKHIVESQGFDAVLTPYFNRFWMVEHIAPQVVRIIDTHDCQSQRTESFARHGLRPTFTMTPEAEGAKLGLYDLALAMSKEDHAVFSGLSDVPLVTAPFRLPPQPLYRTRPNARDLLFIAAKSAINDLTLAYLMRDILPLVGRPVSLHVVGNVTVPDTVPDNVTLVRHQDVEDVAWVYGAVDLALNPTYAGGGVKTKNLEAIRYAVPVITSDEGARGMRNLLPEALIVNDKERFALTIRTLLEDPEQREALSKEMQTRLAAEDAESWLQPFRHIVQGLAAAKREGAAA